MNYIKLIIIDFYLFSSEFNIFNFKGCVACPSQAGIPHIIENESGSCLFVMETIMCIYNIYDFPELRR